MLPGTCRDRTEAVQLAVPGGKTAVTATADAVRLLAAKVNNAAQML